MELILLTYGIPQETVNAIIMMYKNTRAKFRSPDGDTDFFDIIAGVLQGEGFTLTKSRSSRNSAITNTDADYADDLNSCHIPSLLHSIETELEISVTM